MNRFKRLLVPFAAAAATLMLAVPAVASASVGIEQEGKALPVGSALSLTNVGAVTFPNSKFTTIGCESWTMNAKLVKNTEESSKRGAFWLTEAGVQSANNCSTAGGGVVTVTNIKLNQLSSTLPGVGTINFSFEALIGNLQCKFSASALPFSFKTGTNLIQISEGKLTPTPSTCGASWSMNAAFTVTSNGKTVSLD